MHLDSIDICVTHLGRHQGPLTSLLEWVAPRSRAVFRSAFCSALLLVQQSISFSGRAKPNFSQEVWHLKFLRSRFTCTAVCEKQVSCDEGLRSCGIFYFKKKFALCQGLDDGVAQCDRMFWWTESPCSSFRCVLSACGPLALTHSLNHILSEPLGGARQRC